MPNQLMLKPQKIRLVAMSLSGIYSLQQLSRFSPSSLSFYFSMSLRKGLRGSGLLSDGSSLGHPFPSGSVSGALGCTVDVGQKMQARE
jgi:hypothetical protein